MTSHSGTLEGLEVEASGAEAARYTLCLGGGTELDLNGHLGRSLTLTFTGTVSCRHCGAQGRRSFGGGYCYDCFRTLARCDLCVVSPDRCHYAQGTCREPAWGEAFCMQPHRVYLANSSGIKVGITRAGRERRRWLDQGAIQGLVILDADSRHAAGLAEVAIARRLPDRTDWRKMLRADVPELDLVAARAELRQMEPDLPHGVRWSDDRTVTRLRYPLERGEPPRRLLRLDDGPVRGNLLGMKGQYLVLTEGAFNVAAHLGHHIDLTIGEPLPPSATGGDQLGLF